MGQVCKICKEYKEFSEYNKNSQLKSGHYYQCKACLKQLNKVITKRLYKEKGKSYWRDKNKQFFDDCKDGYYYVYLLPDHDYVGHTNNLTFRMRDHRNVYGRNTDNMQVLGSFKTRDEAKAYELQKHKEGYLGRYGAFIPK